MLSNGNTVINDVINGLHVYNQIAASVKWAVS